GRGGTDPSNLLDHDHGCECIGAYTRVGLGDMRSMEVRRYERFERRLRKLGQFVGFGGVRSDLFLAQLPYGGAECLVLLGRPVHVAEVAHPPYCACSRIGLLDPPSSSSLAEERTPPLRSSSVRRRAIYRRSEAGSLFGCALQTVCSNGSQSSGKSSGLSTE